MCKLSNGNTIVYKDVDGTCYETKMILADGTTKEYQTNDALICQLEQCLNDGRRVRVWYGYKDGRAWNESFDVTGRIGRSTGTFKVPLLISTRSSWGGGCLNVGHIIRIDDISTHSTIYKQENFHVEPMEIVEADKQLQVKGYTHSVMQSKDDGSIVNVANFKSKQSAVRWVNFMTGNRYNK